MAYNKLVATVVTKSVAMAIGAVCLNWANIAGAAPLLDVSGSWKIIGNQSAGVLKVTQNASTLPCKPISGTIYNTNPVVGYYCPATGRLAFTRQILGSSAAQVWIGNVSDVIREPNRMGGTFHAVNTGAGSGYWASIIFKGRNNPVFTNTRLLIRETGYKPRPLAIAGIV